MPYEGDSPVEAWEYWFDEPPSDAVQFCLKQRGKEHSAAAIIQAIEITGAKFPMIEGDDHRLQYMTGVLRRKALERLAPERAEEERKVDSILACWTRKGLYSWPLNRAQVRGWLEYIDAEGIKALIHVSKSWRDFKAQIDDILAERLPVETEAKPVEVVELPSKPARRRRRR